MISHSFQAFTIFCGLGINNTLLYEEVSLSNARQTVALEVLSYHTATSADEVVKMKVWRKDTRPYHAYIVSASIHRDDKCTSMVFRSVLLLLKWLLLVTAIFVDV